MPAETRSLKRARTTPYAKHAIVGRISELLAANERVHGFENQLRICSEMFEYLASHRRFVVEHEKFGNAVSLKLCEFLVSRPYRCVDTMVTRAARNIFCMSKNELIERVCKMHSTGDVADGYFSVDVDRINRLRCKMD